MLEHPTDTGRRYRGIAAAERQAERRERLLAAALDCFGTQGYHATSVKALCAAAGLTERYFYESFANSEALLRALYDWLVTRLRAETAAAAAGARPVEAALDVYFRAIEADPRIARVLFFEVLGVSEAVDQRYRRAMEDFGAFLMTLAGGGAAAGGPRREIAGHGLVGAVVHIAMRWVLAEFRTPRAVVVSTCAELLQAMGMADRRA